jgi:hypothetical protein
MPDDVWYGSSTCSLSSDEMSIKKGVNGDVYKHWPCCPEKAMAIEVSNQPTPSPGPEVAGVTKIKAVEAVGGKKGKYLMYAGYV